MAFTAIAFSVVYGQTVADSASALKEADALLKTDPANPRLWTARGAVLLQLHREKEALTSFDKALGISPKFLAAARGAAEAAYTLRDPSARKYAETLLALAPADPAGNAIAGVLAFEAKDCPGAIAHFEKSGPLISGNAPALFQYGTCLARAERYADAASVFQKSLATGRAAPATRYNLALCRYLLHDPRGAIEALGPAVTSESPDTDSLNLYAAALNDDGQVELAIKTLRRATELYPHEVRNYIDLALICLEHTAEKLALEVLTVGVANNPESAQLRTMRGTVYAQGGQVELAQADFDEASRLEPDRLYGSVGMSMLLRQTGQADAAVKLLEQKLKQAGDDPVVNFLYADALWREGIEPGQPAFAKAEQALKRAVALKPDFAQAHAFLGKLYRTEHNNRAALTELQLAAKYNPHDRVALNQLVLVLRAEGHTEEAQKVAGQLKAILDQERVDEVNRNRIRLVPGQ